MRTLHDCFSYTCIVKRCAKRRYDDGESLDTLKVSLGSEHTHTVFKCMQEAYLAGTKDAYGRLCTKIWMSRSSRNTGQYQLALRSNSCSTLLDILENDMNFGHYCVLLCNH
jgi:hypothetical protein